MIGLIKSSEWLQVGIFVALIYLGIGIKNLLSSIFVNHHDSDEDTNEVEYVEIMPGMTAEGVQNMMSSYERHITRLRKKLDHTVKRVEFRNKQLLKMNNYLNELRDAGRITKDEIELYFKKD